MGNNHAQSQKLLEKKAAPAAEVDYAPKDHSLRDQIFFGVKLIAIGAGMLVLLWLIEW